MDAHARLALLGRLLRAASHELNNPLTTISGFAQLLHERAEDPQIRGGVQEIMEAAAAASAYVAGLGRLAGGITPGGTIELASLVDQALALVSYELRAAGVVLSKVGPDRAAVVGGSPGQILEALLHLFVDALDGLAGLAAVTRGVQRITVSTGIGGDSVTLVVTAESEAVHWEAAGVHPPGRWMGLDRCRSLIESLGGSLEFRVVGGSRAARLRFPLVEQPEGAVGEPGRSACRPLTLLVADDDAGMRMLLHEMLEGVNVAVTAVASAEEAVATALRIRPHRLLIDLRMPGGGGQAVWERLSALDSEIARRIVFVTGDALNERSRAFLDSTGRALVAKPFRIEQLRSALDLNGGERPS